MRASATTKSTRPRARAWTRNARWTPRTPASAARPRPRRIARPSISRAFAQVDILLAKLRTREQELAKTGRIVDYERDATLTGVRKMISDLEGPSDPNPFILAIRAAFDVKRKGLYATSPTA